MIPAIVLSILFLDRLTKFIATESLSSGRSVGVIKGVFHLSLVHNRGAAFGMLKDQLPLFVVSSLLAIVLIFFSLKEHNKNKIYSLSLSLILAGAIGNLIDRLAFGYVIDFLDFRVWPVFNVADSAITVGAVLLGWSLLTAKSKTQTS